MTVKYFVSGLLLLVLSSSNSNAQNWREMINDPNVDFEDIQAAFYQEFGDSLGQRGSGWKQFKRWEWFMEQRLNERGEMPNPRLIYEEVKRAELQQQFRNDNGNWQLIGPIDEPANTNGRSIGRVSAIAFHPTDTNQMWAGAPSGGLWKSEDNGLSWETLTDELPNLGVSDIIIHPHNPDTMYLSTGDGSSSNTYSYGVIKSTDGGMTWDTTGLSFGVDEGRNIRRMILDTTNTQVLIAASTSGIYRSQDAGDSWTLVQFGNFCDVEFKPFSNDTVYASRADNTSNPFVVSYDNGLTWSASSTGLNSAEIRRMKIAISPDAPNSIFVVCGNLMSGLQGIYLSEDAGASWSLLANSPNMMVGDQYGAEEGGQAWYSMDIAVNPNNADEIKIGGINIWESTDRGDSFFLEAHWTAANGIYVHADQHRLEYHPKTGQFYAGNDGGVYRKSYFFNGYEPISTAMSITQFYRLANSVSDPTLILGGSQDNGTFRWRDDSWQAIYGGDGMEAMIHPEDPNIMYCTTQRGSLYRSNDGGFNFIGNLEPTEGAWVTPFMMEPGNPDVIYAASDSKVYRSDNEANSWYELSPALTSFNTGPLVLLDVSQSNTEYIVSGSRRTLRLTKDLGGTWENIIFGLPALNMTFVAFDPLNENTIWVTFSGYTDGDKVYRSTDAGETWQNMSMNLPNLPVNCVEIERSSTGGVYVGTDVGVYYWDESLSEWEPFMTGLPNVIVNELEIHESANMIRAATYGRGIWESETRNFINVGIREAATSSENNLILFPNPVKDILRLRFTQTPEQFTIIDAYGRSVMSIAFDRISPEMELNVSRLPSGTYYVQSESRKLLGRFIVQ